MLNSTSHTGWASCLLSEMQFSTHHFLLAWEILAVSLWILALCGNMAPILAVKELGSLFPYPQVLLISQQPACGLLSYRLPGLLDQLIFVTAVFTHPGVITYSLFLPERRVLPTLFFFFLSHFGIELKGNSCLAEYCWENLPFSPALTTSESVCLFVFTVLLPASLSNKTVLTEICSTSLSCSLCRKNTSA